MILEGDQQIFMAMLGGVAAEILHWYVLSRKPDSIEPYLKEPLYWIMTLAMILLGGLMPILYLNGPASALLCFHLGISTPVLLQKLLSQAPSPPPGPDGDSRSIDEKALTKSSSTRSEIIKYFSW